MRTLPWLISGLALVSIAGAWAQGRGDADENDVRRTTRYGQVVGIAVVLNDSQDDTVRALHAWMLAHLAEHKMPTRWWVVSDIPRTSRGKINREAVRDACAAQGALDMVQLLGQVGKA